MASETIDVDTQTAQISSESQMIQADAETDEKTTQTQTLSLITMDTQTSSTELVDTNTQTKSLEMFHVDMQTIEVTTCMQKTQTEDVKPDPVAETKEITTQTKSLQKQLSCSTTQTKDLTTETTAMTTQTMPEVVQEDNLDSGHVSTTSTDQVTQTKTLTQADASTTSQIDMSTTTTQTKNTFPEKVDTPTQTKVPLISDCTTQTLKAEGDIQDVAFPTQHDDECSCQGEADYRADDIECSYSCSSDCSSCSCLDLPHSLEPHVKSNIIIPDESEELKSCTLTSVVDQHVLESISPDLSIERQISPFKLTPTTPPPLTKPASSTVNTPSPDLSSKDQKRSNARKVRHNSGKNPQAVQFEITPKGVRVISEKESFL